MGDLTPFIAQTSKTVQAIYSWHKSRGDAEPRRGYLGASIIGHECDRYLWYVFRGLVREDIEGRNYRLFQTGHLAEGRFVDELRGIGCTVKDVDENGEQWEVSSAGGHFSGHMDAAILGVEEAPETWHVGEFKTHNAKSFAKLLKEGVRPSKPMHWAQMQAYMGGTGMKRALYLAVNKDTDELYCERVKYDADADMNFIERAGRIIRASQAPERVASRQDDWRCRFCSGYELCWGVDRDGLAPAVAVPIPVLGCKSCCHSTAETGQEGAAWSCSRYDSMIFDDEVGAHCPAHLMLPGLIPWAEPTDADGDWIEMTSRDGTVWRMGAGDEAWSSRELIAAGGPREFGRKLPMALADDLPLIARYPWEDSEKVWSGKATELAGALLRVLGHTPEELNAMEPLASQVDDEVVAGEYRVGGSDYLVVAYVADRITAIWRGKQ